MSRYVFVGHTVGATAAPRQKYPFGQAVHSEASLRSSRVENVPDRHGLASGVAVFGGQKFPRLHRIGRRDPTSQAKPAGQSVHSVAAVRYYL